MGASLQLKGTDICMDFTCDACGHYAHIDGEFIYSVQCVCGAVWVIDNKLTLTRDDRVEASVRIADEPPEVTWTSSDWPGDDE